MCTAIVLGTTTRTPLTSLAIGLERPQLSINLYSIHQFSTHCILRWMLCFLYVNLGVLAFPIAGS